MAIDVRIPTILRSYTGGEKAVEGSGDTIGALLTDLDARHPGLRDRLIKDGALHRFVNVYVNDEDVRFLGSLDAVLKDGDNVTILPAVAGGAFAFAAIAAINGAVVRPHASAGQPWRGSTAFSTRAAAHPLVGLPRLSPVGRCPAVGEARRSQSDRQRQRPRRALHGACRRGGGSAPARRHDPGADQRQHRHRAGHGGEAARLPAGLRDAGERLDRAHRRSSGCTVPRSSSRRPPAARTRPSLWPGRSPRTIPTG